VFCTLHYWIARICEKYIQVEPLSSPGVDLKEEQEEKELTFISFVSQGKLVSVNCSFHLIKSNA
jgi:hypothetical protein